MTALEFGVENNINLHNGSLPSSFLVCRRCYIQNKNTCSLFRGLMHVKDKVAHFRISSFLDPQDVGRLSCINSEWHGLMFSNIADIALWRPFCRKVVGEVLTKQQCREFIMRQEFGSNMLPHQDLYIRKHLLRQDIDVAVKYVSCLKSSLAIISTSTLMRFYGTMATEAEKKVKAKINESHYKSALNALEALISLLRRYRNLKTQPSNFDKVFALGSKRSNQGKSLKEETGCLEKAHKTECNKVVIYATGALMNAALIDDIFRDEIIRLKGLDCFAYLLGQYDAFDRLSKYSSGALWNLCLKSRYCRHAMGKYVKVLVARLQTFWSNSDDNISSYCISTVTSCAGTIAASCSENYHENQVELVQVGGIEALLLIISKGKNMTGNKKIILNCCAAIRNVLIKQSKAQKIFRDSGGVPLMMELLNPETVFNGDPNTAAQTAAAVLINSTNEDEDARVDIDIHMLCTYLMHPQLSSSNAILYSGILQNATCGSPKLTSKGCDIILTCCDVYATRIVERTEVVGENLTLINSNEMCCLTRLMCTLRNLLSNPVNWTNLNGESIVRICKYVKRHCSKNARYHACKILEDYKRKQLSYGTSN